MTVKLYVICGSHACRTAMLMLEHKRLPYELVELPTGLHPIALRLHGFAGNPRAFREIDGRTRPMISWADRLGTTPALKIDGRRAMTNRAIARLLEELCPEPPLFPADQAERREVERAERFGDEVLQMAARRVILATAARDYHALTGDGGEGGLGPLLYRGPRRRALAARAFAPAFRATPAAEAKLLDALPAMLQRIEAWIGAGVLNTEQRSAADYMIAPSLALLCYRPDLRAEIESRPAGELLHRLLPRSSDSPADQRSGVPLA